MLVFDRQPSVSGADFYNYRVFHIEMCFFLIWKPHFNMKHPVLIFKIDIDFMLVFDKQPSVSGASFYI